MGEGEETVELGKQEIVRMMTSAADALDQHIDELTAIDSHFGDGDHGITIAKITAAIRSSVEDWEDESIQEFFDNTGMAIMGVRGGSAGPLYGTLVGGLGVELTEDENVLDAQAVKRMFSGCLSEMQDTTDAQVGDKTMMDALIPAVEAALAASDEVRTIVRAAADAAAQGTKTSEQFASKYGRARSYGDQTIGTPDAGAVSTSLFFEGFAQGIDA